MIEIATIRKNKIFLSDYDYKKDIENRSLLASFSELELHILEELLFSPLKTSLGRLSKDLDLKENKILPVLNKLQMTELISVEKDIITIEKKLRKYFEFEYLRFDENFKPDLTFINTLLSKIPIHILPVWYSLPKTSNNIFQSIIDKYFLTPQVFKRHIEDLENENPIFSEIIQKLYNSSTFELSSKEIKTKYNLDNNKYIEYLLLLEFNFVCFQTYKKTSAGYEEILIPFYEYTEYSNHYNDTETSNISDIQKILKKGNSDFSFVEDLSNILQMTKKAMTLLQVENNLKKELSISDPNNKISNSYVNNLINKLVQIKFLIKNQNLFETSAAANKWLELTMEQRALHLYYHPLNILDDKKNLPAHLLTEKSIKEAEKSITRVINKGWVFFDDFIKGVMSTISEDNQLKIKPFGKLYRYSIPSYSQEEIFFIKTVIFERLFEAGIVNTGFFNGKDCFCVTQLGRTLFDIR